MIVKYSKRVSLLIIICLMAITQLFAQEGNGQICIYAFEDRNGNGTEDPGEPPLTHSIGASLADVNNIIVQSILLDDDPRAVSGTMCFQNLTPGQYTVTVTSADINATTETTFITSVTETSIPERLNYGGQSIVTELPTADTSLTPEAHQRASLEKLFWSTLGAIFVISGMFVLGTIIAFLFFRPRRQPPVPYQTPMYGQPGTDAMRPVDPATGQLYTTTDTNQVHAVDPNENYMPPRQDRLDTGAMARFTLEESGTYPPAQVDDAALNDALVSDFVLSDEDTGQSAAIHTIPDDNSYKPPADYSDFEPPLSDDDTGKSAAIRVDDDTDL